MVASIIIYYSRLSYKTMTTFNLPRIAFGAYIFINEKLWHRTEWASVTEFFTHYHHLFTVTEWKLLIIPTFLFIVLSSSAWGSGLRFICSFSVWKLQKKGLLSTVGMGECATSLKFINALPKQKKKLPHKKGDVCTINLKTGATDWHSLKLINIHLCFKHETSFVFSISHRYSLYNLWNH